MLKEEGTDSVDSTDESDFPSFLDICFTVADVPNVAVIPIASCNGTAATKEVFNLVTFNPNGKKRILTVWGVNAKNVHAFFK